MVAPMPLPDCASLTTIAAPVTEKVTRRGRSAERRAVFPTCSNANLVTLTGD
jgi:hypothetical protein